MERSKRKPKEPGISGPDLTFTTECYCNSLARTRTPDLERQAVRIIGSSYGSGSQCSRSLTNKRGFMINWVIFSKNCGLRQRLLWFSVVEHTSQGCNQWSACEGSHLAVAILVRLPQMTTGIVSSVKMPISMPKIPNGSATPLAATHSPTKNVHAKPTTARRKVMATKQSPETELYASIICLL